ncbi:MAG: hypothetical protein HOV81_42330 [Kofleriaceae bacterium]|nr:hypothetical protein [Kofleriaceae bacterium]
MKQVVLAVLVLSGLTVRAQADEPPLDAFLEQRVAEELAADGVLLSRLGVHLDVEVVGDKLLISLVENTTDRAAASTKLDAIPPDRDAAVAAVTQVAATLSSQLVAAPPRLPAKPEPDATAAAVKSALAEDREERRAQLLAEHNFRQEAIYFGNEPVFYTDFKTFAAAGTRVVPYQGELHRKVDGAEFYEIVDRPDLAQRYTRNKQWGWIGAIGGSAIGLTGAVVFSKAALDEVATCPTPSDPYAPCNTGDQQGYKTAGLVMMIGGLGVMCIGVLRLSFPHPASEQERYELAAEYNARLREKYRLPGSTRREEHRIQLGITPYVVGDGGGLVLGGLF